MKKIMKKAMSLILTGAMAVQPMIQPGLETQVQAGVAQNAEFAIPAADANGRIGALMPYTRYDSAQAEIGGGAIIKESKDWDIYNIATQASDQSYISLPGSGAYAEWTMNTTGAGVTMRFTMPDSSDGMGLKGSLDVYVNGNKVRTVDLSSYWMWQYGNHEDQDNGEAPQFAFDEVHFLLDQSLKSGDKIRIQSSGASGLEYGVDFIEVENVPAPIEQPDNSVNVMDYGAVPNDGGDDLAAIRAAVEDADARGMDVYFPEGTFTLSGMWNLYCSNMKITGAGMWYTNLQFTSDAQGGGGISGGNGSNGGPDGYCKNLEFCNMYLNSGLRSRYGENAIYKCFMDVFADGSVIHDIWEDHFECGFWIADYNGTMDYSDGLKIINCRIRNNLADGVNFCQGTSNAAVYNCSVRNNGDDGLAMWNNDHMSVKDESDNIFAYNTIELIWRAGGIAIYGGTGHKIYNNYIRDMYMASGIHLNTTFPGYKFTNCQGMSFDNNILVKCGTIADLYDEDLAAIDIKDDVKNVTFNNTQIYDSPATAIRLMRSYSGVTFNATKIYGTGISGQLIGYSCSHPHTGVAIRESVESDAVFNGLEIANVPEFSDPLITSWPYYTDNGLPYNIATNSTVTVLGNDVVYSVPSYPAPDSSSQGGGVVDPLEGITGYDVELVGLAWENESGNTEIGDGDKVSFAAAIRNVSNIDIPEGAAIQLSVQVDGKENYTNTTYKGGLKAGETIKISPSAKWTATAGGHTITATADYQNKLPNEITKDNNKREKKFNVQAASGQAPTYTPVTGKFDIVVLDVTWDKEIIHVGDELTFTATIVNAGDQPVPAGKKLGVQFQIDGQSYPNPITWNDQWYDGLEPGQVIKLTATGGNLGTTWAALEGTHTVTAWADDAQDDTGYGTWSETNNKCTKTITIPFDGVQYFEESVVELPDDLSDLNAIQTPTKKPDETTRPIEQSTTTQLQQQTTQTQQQTTQIQQPGFNPADLTYTTIKCEGNEVLTLDYAIQSSSIAGLVPWYGDAGNTLALQFSADAGVVSDVTINGELAGDIVTEKAPGVVKVNPTRFDDNAYSVIKVTLEDGEFVFVVRKGTPTDISIPVVTTDSEAVTSSQGAVTTLSQDVTTPETTTAETTTPEATTPETTTPEATTPETTTPEVTTPEATTPETTTPKVTTPETTTPETTTPEATTPEATTPEATTPETTTLKVTTSETTTPEATTLETTMPVGTVNETKTTTVASTTKNPTTTVVSSTKVSAGTVSVGKTKIKKVKKNFASPKAKISLKKISGAKYQIKVSTTKKFKKKKTVTKMVKKATFTIKNKKIKNRKVLYVKARAYRIVDGTTYYGKWSKVKKVKTK